MFSDSEIKPVRVGSLKSIYWVLVAVQTFGDVSTFEDMQQNIRQ